MRTQAHAFQHHGDVVTWLLSVVAVGLLAQIWCLKACGEFDWTAVDGTGRVVSISAPTPRHCNLTRAYKSLRKTSEPASQDGGSVRTLEGLRGLMAESRSLYATL